MEISFDNRWLREICESEARAVHVFEPRVAERIKRRLADIGAASNVHELVAGSPRELDGPNVGQMSIQLGDKFKMILSANHKEIPVHRSGSIDWKKVNRVKLLRIEGDNA